MAKKDDDLILLIDRYELEKKARSDNKLTDHDSQNFVESIMKNYFLDNDNINFLEAKGIQFFSFDLKEKCFCISGKMYGECCYLKLETKKDLTFMSYVQALGSETDYKNYFDRINKIFLFEYQSYAKEVNCFYPQCESKAIKNLFYHDLNFEKFVSTKRSNSVDARYKMGENFFNDVESTAYEYFGFCEDHYHEIIKLYQLSTPSDLELLAIALNTVIYRLFHAMIIYRTSRQEFLNWYNSVTEEGYRAYMVIHMRKVSGILKGILNIYKLLADAIKNKSVTKFKIWPLCLPETKKMVCRDLVIPQIAPDDFRMINSVNNVLLEPKYLIQEMMVVNKKTYVYYIYEKLDEDISSFVRQYQSKILSHKTGNQSFVSNTSLILTDNILFDKKWFQALEEQEKVIYSVMSKYRLDQPEIGREYIKMQFFASFDKGNNFF